MPPQISPEDQKELDAIDAQLAQLGQADSSQSAPIVPATLGQSTEFVAKALPEAFAKTADIGTSAVLDALISPYTLAKTALTGEIQKPTYVTPFQNLTNKYIGNPEEVGLVGSTPKYVKAALGAVAIPGGNPLLNATSGLTSEAAHQAFPNSNIAPIAGALVPGGIEYLGSKLEAAGNAMFARAAGITARDYKAAQYGMNMNSAVKAKQKLRDALDQLKDNGLGYRSAIKPTEGFLQDANNIAKGLKEKEWQNITNAINPISEKMGAGVTLDWSEIQKIYDSLPTAYQGDFLSEIDKLISAERGSGDTLANIQADKVKWNTMLGATPMSQKAESAYRTALRDTIEKAAPEVIEPNQKYGALAELQKGFVKDMPAAQAEVGLENARQGLNTSGGSALRAMGDLGGGNVSKALAMLSFLKPGARTLGLGIEDIGQAIQKPFDLAGGNNVQTVGAALLNRLISGSPQQDPLPRNLNEIKIDPSASQTFQQIGAQFGVFKSKYPIGFYS